MKRFIKISFLALVILGAADADFAQSKARKKRVEAKVENPAQPPDAAAETAPAATQKTPVKKNGRPDASQQPETQKKNSDSVVPAPQDGYRYEFSQPNFTVKSIVIEHDENGNGKITFEKKDFGEPVSDPLQLSLATLEKLENLYRTLNFLDSTESYQSPERDYAHLGAVKITRLSGDKNRTAEFNWTENLTARSLADEYRRIGNQWVWMFDISVSRENQPLEAPSLMNALDSLIKRNEIADPAQMIPLLRELGDDERIPLMARNRAAKIVKELEKKAAK